MAKAKKQRKRGRHALLLRLAELLHQFGTPAHRLELMVSNVAAGLGVEVEVFSMPTGLFLAFREGEEHKTHLLRVAGGELHLEKQSDLDELAGDLIEGRLSLEQAHRQLEQIAQKPERYPPWLGILAFGVTALAVARIFKGGPGELWVSCVGGLLTGAMTFSFSRWTHLARLTPGLASFAVALWVAAVAAWWGPLAQSACHISSVIILIPGLSLTVAMTEISTHNLVSGTARFAGAMGVLLQIGFGLALGSSLGHKWFGLQPGAPTSAALPGWTFWLALVLAGAAFLVLFRARPSDLLWMIVAGVIAMVGSKWGTQWLGPRLGPFLAAFWVGCSSNLFARWFRRPSSILMIPGIILLVPGSVGVHSITAMMSKHTLQGLDAAFSMMIIIVSLVSGVLVAGLIIPPGRSL